MLPSSNLPLFSRSIANRTVIEVLGLVAAVPRLVELTTGTLVLLRDVSQNRKALSKVTNGLELQLQALSEILNLLSSESHSSLLLSSKRQKLSPLIEQLHKQLGSLNTFLSATQSEKTLQRIKIVATHPKKNLQEHMQKLERSISIIKLYLLEHNITLNEEAVAATIAAKKSQLKNMLKPSSHDFIRTKLDGTLDWILYNPVFHQWLAPKSAALSLASRLLLVYGSKGTGKSVLAASTAASVRSAGGLCAFFSYFHGIERQRKCETMFSTLFWQMLNFNGVSGETLSRAYDIMLNCDSISLGSLLQAIECVASTLKTPFYVVVDGIDESDDDWDAAGGLLRILEGWMRQFTELRVLLVGRHSILHHVLAKYPGRSVELSENVTRADISVFIDNKIRGAPHLNVMPEHVKTYVRETLQEKSTGMFLWVELVFKELRHCYNPNSVADCLKDLPQDLETEYVRLFTRLAYHLHSRLDRPTPSLRAARGLLALVMSALEPLTVGDLRYAYAASCGKSEMWEDELISEDAVFDLIGDFVACTGSGTRYIHFCHYSLEEFLLLPPEKWVGRLKDVEFFRLEYMECHQLMARACIEYVTNFDFGYPCAEGSYQKLVDKDFLLYATKNGLSHFLYWRSTDMEGPLSQIDLLRTYIKGPNFGGLAEFIALASLDRVGFFEDYVSGVILDGLVEILPAIRERIAEESAYRIEKFGFGDPRTLPWCQIHSFFHTDIPLPSSERLRYLQYAQSTTGLRSTGLEEVQIFDEPPAVSFPSSGVPQNHAQALSRTPRRDISTKLSSLRAMNAAVQSRTRSLICEHTIQQVSQIWVDPKATFNKIAQSFAVMLPIPVHMAYAGTIIYGNPELGVALFDLARQRTEGQRTVYRAWAVLTEGAKDDEENVRWRSEGHDIILGLEDNPITRRMLYINVSWLVYLLASLDRKPEIPKLIDDLLDRAITSRPRVNRHRRQQFFQSLIYKTSQWRELEIRELDNIATKLHNRGMFGEAERVRAYLCTCAEAHYGFYALKTRRLRLFYINSLYGTRNFAQAERVAREVLAAHSGSEPRQLETLWFQYYAALAADKQGKYTSASESFKALLQDLEPGEDRTWLDVDIEKAKLAIFARVALLEMLGKSKHAYLDGDLQKKLLGSCLDHLDQANRGDIGNLWRGNTVPRCCAVSEEVYGADHEVTLRLREYISYGNSGLYYLPFLGADRQVSS
ncbi:hypothetical protein F5Y10DRAFT_288079 [Nemania abortiva]|nr:hypothetical protein F5Y10DRAFT_288079 [Nemania abortiva]